MGARRSQSTFTVRRKRLPFVAKVRREDPFRPEDEREIAAAAARVAAASDWLSCAGWREDAGFRVFHFATWAKARAMQHWIDRSGIARRPMPKLGPTADEREADRREALAWLAGSGAAQPVLEAYRAARRRGDGHLTAFNAACDVAHAFGRPTGRLLDTVQALLAEAGEGR